MKFVGLAVAAGAALTLSACATVTRGTSTNWDVQTTPSGARVETTHGYTCNATPCSLRMPRKSQFQATISKPGYKTVTAQVGNRVSGGGGAGLAGNLLMGGIIGAGVDAGTGAALDLRPDPLILVLEEGEGTVTLSQAEAEAASASAQANAKPVKKRSSK